MRIDQTSSGCLGGNLLLGPANGCRYVTLGQGRVGAQSGLGKPAWIEAQRENNVSRLPLRFLGYYRLRTSCDAAGRYESS
jgi:hypothetical protein